MLYYWGLLSYILAQKLVYILLATNEDKNLDRCHNIAMLLFSTSISGAGIIFICPNPLESAFTFFILINRLPNPSILGRVL